MKKQNKTVVKEEILSFVVFRLDNGLFGIDILKVKEITNLLEVSPVPNAPPFISGIIDLRGVLIPIINLRAKLGLRGSVTSKRARILIVSVRGKVAGFISDEVKDVVRVEKDKVKRPPALLKESGGEVFDGIFKLDDDVVFVLNIEKLVTEKEIKDIKTITEVFKREVISTGEVKDGET